jgi:hypothetical protein
MGRLEQRARIGGLALAAGLIAGMSVFGQGADPLDSAPSARRQLLPPAQARATARAGDSLFPHAARCNRPEGAEPGLKSTKGTWGPHGCDPRTPEVVCDVEFDNF